MWKPDSEMSRLARGELMLADCHPDIADVLGLCEHARADSGGAFDARRHLADSTRIYALDNQAGRSTGPAHPRGRRGTILCHRRGW